MQAGSWLQAAVALVPVLAFLGALVAIDSYKLVPLKTVVATVAAGAIAAVAAYFINGALLEATHMQWTSYSRWVAPLAEEIAKGVIVLLLVRIGRIGFLVDAAICGFASGAGFSILENAFYLLSKDASAAGIGAWIIRGFGTAIMHGGATAIFAVTSLALLDRPGANRFASILPGLALAYAVHSAYNHTLLLPVQQMLVVIVVVPAVLLGVFHRSEKALGQWLGSGFDADAQLLELLNSGQFSDSPLGKYLLALRQRFQGPLVADMVCYVRLHTELALRAKGLLMLRETGFADSTVDASTREKFAELHYLERSIGPAGQMAIRPMLHLSRKDLRQLYLIE
jgi:RsiW-degrading membrane proteinase PrsW (M82 family)